MTTGILTYNIPVMFNNNERYKMKDQTTEKLLDVINDLISLVKKNTDNINKLAHEIARLKEVKNERAI